MIMPLAQRIKLPSVLQGEKGSIAVLIAFLMPVMLLMLVMLVNINHLVFTKLMLQNTVDACALSAAAVQAAGLNEIADLNREMTKENKKIRKILSSGIWYDYRQANNAQKFFYNGKTGVIDWIQKYQKNANTYFAVQSEAAAQQVKRWNFPQTRLTARHDKKRLTGLKGHDQTATFVYYTVTPPKGSPVPTLNWFDPDDPQFEGDHDGTLDIPMLRTVPLPGEFKIIEKMEKTSPTYADYEITLPRHPFILGDAIFKDVPVLKARASARPAGGDIYRGKPEYKAVLFR
ncbi:MAG: hypothetical protein C4518_19045 [Desulfobacteraceae bacterium]|nr:MAG: hypothetical protein C4518_19045 [Desulfobacteraceae bacterium]